MLGILPVVGSSGFYQFAAPFDLAAIDQVEYTCKAIRRISDYLANNEDVKADIYDANGLSDAVWEEDSIMDADIVSLQAQSGHWLYIPSRYVLAYPSVNGVPYRAVMIGISLPSMPLTQDFSAIKEDVKDLVDTALGVNSVVKHVETSKVVLIEHSVHETKQQERLVSSQGQTTLSAKLVKLRQENDLLLAKVAALETFIKTHHVP